jgi:hypothetical protein
MNLKLFFSSFLLTLFHQSIIIPIESIENIYKREILGAGVRQTFIDVWILGSPIPNSLNIGKCLRQCTINRECTAGEYNITSKVCTLLKIMPVYTDIVAKNNTYAFYRGFISFYLLIYKKSLKLINIFKPRNVLVH